jgi:hypothetical protein
MSSEITEEIAIKMLFYQMLEVFKGLIKSSLSGVDP